ncbi:hypothetical protein DBL07_26550, partial [Achromobacter mucicolens]|uniref:hypothetical protein n=1 Tax=Achromobacter mucicolens TaxID=1389922 RepID=UPI000D408472
DELINQLGGNRRQFSQRGLCLGSHTCSLSNMLGLKHKIYDTPAVYRLDQLSSESPRFFPELAKGVPTPRALMGLILLAPRPIAKT